MSFKNNHPPVRYVNAAFPPLDERLCNSKAEPVPDVEPAPGFGYTVAFACRMETFRQYVSPYLSLQLKKTEEEAAIRQWDEKPQGHHTYVACDVRAAEEKSLAVRWYSNPSSMLVIDAVEPHDACSAVVKEAFVPVRPAIRMGEQLGLPTEGYLYHFLEGRLVSEFRCMGDTYPRFQVTQSRPEAMYPEPAVDRPLEYILALWQRNGQVIQDQYLLYSREALSDEAIQSMDTAFLQAHGVRLDMHQMIPLTENSGQRQKHTVAEGETLSEIAEQHQITLETLLALNPYWRGRETKLTIGSSLYLEPVGIYNHGQDVSYPVSAALLGEGVFAIEPSKTRADFPVVQVAESDGGRFTALSPVRYALDACNAQGQGLHPIPDTETFSGGIFQADDTPYTLRQLRDGWLYALSPVPDSETWTLEEYKIEQGEFRRVIGQTAEARQKAEPGRPKTHILCVSDRPYYLAYAVKRWTDRICDYYLGNAEARDCWLRQVNLNTSGAATHRTDVAQVECYVADVNAQAQERFAGTCAPLSGDVDRPNDFIHIPPKKTLASYTYQAPSAYAQQIVALDDPLADLSDLYLALLEPVLTTTPDEPTHRKVVLAEAIRSMVRVPIPKDKMPEILPEQWVEFESALDVCLEYEYQKVHLPQLGSDNMMPQRLKDLEAYRQASLKAQATLEGMGFFGVEDYVQDYTDRRKAHSQVNWDDLDAFYKDYLASQSHAYAAIPGAFDRLLSALPKLGTEPMHLGLDILYSDHMGYLMELFGELLPALNSSAHDETMQRKLADALIQEKPDNLMALASSFFSAEFYAKTDELVKESDVIDLQRESVPVTGVVAGLNSVLGYGLKSESGLYHLTLAMAVPLDGLIESAIGALNKVTGQGFQRGCLTYQGIAMRKAGFRAGFNVAAMAWSLEQVSQGKIGMNPAFEGTSRAYRQRFTGAVLEWQSLENQLKRMPADSSNRASLELKQQKMEARVGQMVTEAPGVFESFNGQDLRSYHGFVDRASQGFSRIGRLDFVVAFLNAINVVAQQIAVAEILASTPNVDASTQLHVVGFSTAWLMHATSEIFRGLAFERVKQHSVLLNQRLNQIVSSGKGIDVKAIAQNYVKRSVMTGMLGVIAAGWEAYRTFLDAGKADFNLEKGLLYTKSLILGVQGFTWGILAIRGLISSANRLAIGAVLQGWMVAAWLWLGIAYLVVSVLLNMLQKSPLENWLRKSIWGKEPQGDWTATAEYQALLQILNQPQIQGTVKSFKQLPGTVASPYAPLPYTFQQQLKITFPQQRPGQCVSVGVTVSGLREREVYEGYHKVMKVDAFSYPLTALDIARGYWEYDEHKVPALVLDIPIWVERIDTIRVFATVNNRNPFAETAQTAQHYQYQLHPQLKTETDVMKDGKASDMIGHQLFSVKIEEL